MHVVYHEMVIRREVMSGDDGDEQNRKGLQRSMVVVMAGDDGDEQRTEQN